MFPGVDGFRWDAGHIIFLGAFFSVALIIAATVAAALVRSLHVSPRKEQAIRWRLDFSALAPSDRRCRHELTGEVRSRECTNGLDCRTCPEHPKLEAARRGVVEEGGRAAAVRGISVPGDRLFHRGHTWARSEADGTYTVGLDELGARLVGPADEVELPKPGSRVYVNGTAWTVRQGPDRLRVLSPVDGEVLATGDGSGGWVLKVRPARGFRTDHLLKGAEAAAWMASEIERLQLAAGMEAGPAAADGGALVSDLTRELPGLDWAGVRARMFLNG